MSNQTYRDLYDEVATLRQELAGAISGRHTPPGWESVAALQQAYDQTVAELARAETGCASAMAEAEALQDELESVRVLLWPDGGARTVPQQRTDGFAAAVRWLLMQRVTLTTALDEEEKPVVEAAKAWRAQLQPDGHTPTNGPWLTLAAAVDVFYGAQPCICRPSHRDDDPICQYRRPVVSAPLVSAYEAKIPQPDNLQAFLAEEMKDPAFASAWARRNDEDVTHGPGTLAVGAAIRELRRARDGGGE